ncbi:MAG: hypothetical protein O3C28_12180 [Proteobacteria bacterium]|nr:hypothetical protein [Pseudomonadota bacterium]
MNAIRIQLSDAERTCTVDENELHGWSKALLDDILFAAAKDVSKPGAEGFVRVIAPFVVRVDADDGSVLIEACN